jgi:hypothetical protein
MKSYCAVILLFLMSLSTVNCGPLACFTGLSVCQLGCETARGACLIAADTVLLDLELVRNNFFTLT